MSAKIETTVTGRGEATALFALFAVEFVVTLPSIRYYIIIAAAAAYTLFTIVLLIRQRRQLPAMLKAT